MEILPRLRLLHNENPTETPWMASSFTMKILRPAPIGSQNCSVSTQDTKNISLDAARGAPVFIAIIKHSITTFIHVKVEYMAPTLDNESAADFAFFGAPKSTRKTAARRK